MSTENEKTAASPGTGSPRLSLFPKFASGGGGAGGSVKSLNPSRTEPGQFNLYHHSKQSVNHTVLRVRSVYLDKVFLRIRNSAPKISCLEGKIFQILAQQTLPVFTRTDTKDWHSSRHFQLKPGCRVLSTVHCTGRSVVKPVETWCLSKHKVNVPKNREKLCKNCYLFWVKKNQLQHHIILSFFSGKQPDRNFVHLFHHRSFCTKPVNSSKDQFIRQISFSFSLSTKFRCLV